MAWDDAFSTLQNMALPPPNLRGLSRPLPGGFRPGQPPAGGGQLPQEMRGGNLVSDLTGFVPPTPPGFAAPDAGGGTMVQRPPGGWPGGVGPSTINLPGAGAPSRGAPPPPPPVAGGPGSVMQQLQGIPQLAQLFQNPQMMAVMQFLQMMGGGGRSMMGGRGQGGPPPGAGAPQGYATGINSWEPPPMNAPGGGEMAIPPPWGGYPAPQPTSWPAPQLGPQGVNVFDQWMTPVPPELRW